MGKETTKQPTRDYFPFYWSFADAIRELADGDRLALYDAITNYAFFQEEPDLETAFARFGWKLIKPILEKSQNKSDNGRKGGRPKSKPKANQKQIKSELKANQKQIKSNKDKDIDKDKGRNNWDLSFVPNEYQDAFKAWLQYKEEIKDGYKSQSSVDVCFKHLLELSCNNPSKAKMIIQQSIANNWKGLFDVKLSKKAERAQWEAELADHMAKTLYEINSGQYNQQQTEKPEPPY